MPLQLATKEANPTSSGATGGSLDTQGRFSFGGITTTGVGGKTSTNDISSYVAMGIVAAVALGLGYLLFKR